MSASPSSSTEKKTREESDIDDLKWLHSLIDRFHRIQKRYYKYYVDHPTKKSQEDKEFRKMRMNYDIFHYQFKLFEKQLQLATQESDECYRVWSNTPFGKAYHATISNISRELFNLAKSPYDPEGDVQRGRWFFSNIWYLTSEFFSRFHVDQERHTNPELISYEASLQRIRNLKETYSQLLTKKVELIREINAKSESHLGEKRLYPPPKILPTADRLLIKKTFDTLLKESEEKIVSCPCGHMYVYGLWMFKSDIHGQFQEDGTVVYSCSGTLSTSPTKKPRQ
jgi:hypothetical protein